VLSGGKTYLGLGGGCFESEARGLGLPVPSQSERYNRLKETLWITKQMWVGDLTPCQEKYYQLDEPSNPPQPLKRPHLPILIGDGGEKKSLRLVAKYADAYNLVIGAPKGEFSILNMTYELWFDRL
jgi:alkanesulfonate monooxygenase SsuD/methylene tetrahydromethanopterin reductase-like flavin-dependent oxidoreductase (luciferase family)